MKVLAVFVFALVSVCYAAEKAAEPANAKKIYKRLLPADVLRDFPGRCFASTQCSTYEPGQSWDLTPFCGRSTCVVSEGEQAGRLLELVEDCGPMPLANPKCKISPLTNRTAPFPECCPTFECEDGVTLEYPELPVLKEGDKSEKNGTAKP